MKMNKTTLKEFRKDFKNAVESLENKYGIDLSLGNITYSSDEFHGKLSAAVKLTDKEQQDKRQREFDIFCMSKYKTELKSNMLDKKFVGIDGKMYKLIGCKPNAKKNCLVIENENGTEYVCPIGFLKFA